MDSSYTSSLRRGYIVALFEKHGLFDEFKKEHWPFGNSPAGERKRLRYLRIKGQYEEFLAGRGPEVTAESGDEGPSDPEQALEFALEAHLRDFLAKILSVSRQVSGCMIPPSTAALSFPLTVAA